ncbi:MAG: hypothetical protein ACYC4Q_04070 [Victivallaceae bacterium]
MSSNYSEEYFRELVLGDICLSLQGNRLDLNNISIDESKPVPVEDLLWAIQTMEENALLQRVDDSNYDLTEAGVNYLQSLKQMATPEAETQAPPAEASAPAAEAVPQSKPAAASNDVPAIEFEDRAAALNHLIYESFIYNKTLELTSFGPLILRDHKPEIYGKYKFTKEEIDFDLETKARQGILFFRQVEEDGLDGGQDSYRVPAQKEGEALNPEDYIPEDIKGYYIALRDDFAASEALEHRLVNTEMRSQYKAERSELFLMTELPLDTDRSKCIMDKFIQIVSFSETLPEHLQKEYLNKAIRIVREYYKPDYLLTAEERLENEVNRIREIEELNKKYYKLFMDYQEQEELKKAEDESHKHSFKYKMSHTFHDLKSILNKTNKHQEEGIK